MAMYARLALIADEVGLKAEVRMHACCVDRAGHTSVLCVTFHALL